jgi:hypothetical protein
MTVRTYRVAAASLCVALSVLALVAFGSAPLAGSAYVMTFTRGATSLPTLTAAVALPLLRVAPGDPHDRPVTKWWVWLTWLALAAVPAATAAAVSRCTSVEAATARFVLGLSAFATLALAMALAVGVGVATALACL